MKKIFLGISLLLLGTSLTGCGSSITAPFEEGDVIRVGMECAYAPFNWTSVASTDYSLPIKNAQGYVDGYDVQIAKYIGEKLGCTVEIYSFEWDSLIMELKMNTIDLIIAGMSPTEKRKEEVYFSDAYYTAQHVVLMDKDSEYTTAKNLDDFTGANAVAQVNTVYNDLVDQLDGVTKMVAPTSVNDCVIKIKAGDADISIVELPVAQAICKSNPDLTYVVLEEAFILDDADKYVSIAMSMGSDELRSQINGILATLSEVSRTNFMNQAVERQDA